MNYAKIRDNTAKKIKANGKPVILKRSSSTDDWEKKFDPVTGRDYWENTSTGDVVYTEPTGSPMEYSGYALQISAKESQMDSSLIREGEIILMCVDIPETMPGDIISVDGKQRVRVRELPFSPGDTVIYREVVVR